MSIQETHEWAKKKMASWQGITDEFKKLSQGFESENPKKIATPPHAKFENASFIGDVCRRDGDLIFHFFPTTNDRFNVKVDVAGEKVWVFGDAFADNLGDSFNQVFKHAERLFWDFVPELNSWVVRCAGFGDNPLSDVLVEQVLVTLKEKNKEDA